MSASRGLPSWAQRDVVRYFCFGERLGGEARIVGGAMRIRLLVLMYAKLIWR